MSAVIDVKTKEQFFERDPTSDFFPFLSLDTQYEMVSRYCSLHNGVPEDVRSYFNVVVTLYLYGWLYYPFYMLANERSFFVVEMALRKRLPPKKVDKKGRDRRSLSDLFREAGAAGLLRDEGFPSIVNRRMSDEEMKVRAAELGEALGQEVKVGPPEPFIDVLIKGFHTVRNRFAHPDMQMIMPPGPILDTLNLAAEIINQLWPSA